MSINYFDIFKKRLNEEETVVTQETDKDKILRNSKKVTSVLTKLLSSQKNGGDKSLSELQDLISDIKVISYKPTTFRIVVANSNYFDLIYDPAPMQVQYPEDYQDIDSFTVKVAGKKYKIGNNSQFEQALDALNKIMRENPIGTNPEIPDEDTGSEEPEDTSDVSGDEKEDPNATDKKES